MSKEKYIEHTEFAEAKEKVIDDMIQMLQAIYKVQTSLLNMYIHSTDLERGLLDKVTKDNVEFQDKMIFFIREVNPDPRIIIESQR